MKTLSIDVTRRCNFSCASCINSSHRGRTDSLSDAEISRLVELINFDSDIREVNFTGGEPTLEKDKIRAIQREIRRQVLYRLTTNGWFGRQGEEFLLDLELHKVLISYDKFHRQYVSVAEIEALVKSLKKRSVEVVINYVFDSIEDIQEAAVFKDWGVEVRFNRAIRGGRARFFQKRLEDRNAADLTCPSLEKSLHPGTEKVNYHIAKGFSPCCGPLAYDELGHSQEVFTPLDGSYESNILRNQLQSGTFAQQAARLGLDIGGISFSAPCDVCAFLYGRIEGH